MSEFGQYLLEASINLGIFYVFFWLIARKSTLHRFNRWLLLGLVLFSLCIPLLEFNLNAGFQEEFYEWDLNVYEEISTNVAPIFTPDTKQVPQQRLYGLIGIYLLGISALLLRFVQQIWFICQLRKISVKVRRKDTDVYLTSEASAFSFFNWIFIPQTMYQSKDMEPVLIHEHAHARQGHSWDLLMLEILCMVFWFHPFVWFWRKTLKKLHEYLADQAVIREGYPMLDYLLVLKRFIGSQSNLSISHSFSSPIIIQRFRMLNHSTTKLSTKAAYLILLPVLMAFLLACNVNEEVKATIGEKVVQPITYTSLSPVVSYQDKPVATPTPSPIPSISPLNGNLEVTSDFGMRIHPQTKKEHFHFGVDYRASEGTPVLATADGLVAEAKMYPKYGNKLVIEHGQGYKTLFAHLQGFNVKAGQKVKKGEVIAYVGNTGYSKGPHLHYEIIKDGKRVNPSNYMPK